MRRRSIQQIRSLGSSLRARWLLVATGKVAVVDVRITEAAVDVLPVARLPPAEYSTIHAHR